MEVSNENNVPRDARRITQTSQSQYLSLGIIHGRLGSRGPPSSVTVTVVVGQVSAALGAAVRRTLAAPLELPEKISGNSFVVTVTVVGEQAAALGTAGLAAAKIER